MLFPPLLCPRALGRVPKAAVGVAPLRGAPRVIPARLNEWGRARAHE